MIWVLLGSKGTPQAVLALNLVLFSYRKIVPAGIHRRSYANGQYLSTISEIRILSPFF